MQEPDDPFDLSRFVTAQEPVIARVSAELAAGRKTSHWMWFVFPQLRGLGSSSMARRYAIASLHEARAYLAHPVLGTRLRHTTEQVLAIDGHSAWEIFGTPDDVKFRSSMTLFALAEPNEPVFRASIEKYFAGERDERTVEAVRDE
jgi:uncharacterized protein (DUF1810 family)